MGDKKYGIFVCGLFVHIAPTEHKQELNLFENSLYTGCGRKKSPIWEANKFETKEDMANVFLFLESTQNAVLHCVLNKTSLKWRP